MTRDLSRRAFLAAAAGACGAIAAGSCGPRRAATPTGEADVAAYVDHEGWMLTPEDRQKLLTEPLDQDATR